MSNFSFSYKIKNEQYYMTVSAKDLGVNVQILADKNRWITFSSKNKTHPYSKKIQSCLLQHALLEISKNKVLKDELLQLTKFPAFYKERMDNIFIQPCIKLLDIQPNILTKEYGELILCCNVFYQSVVEEVKIFYSIRKERKEIFRIVHDGKVQKLKTEGFPLEMIEDEHILSALEKNVEIEQELAQYVLFLEHILLVLENPFGLSFSVFNYFQNEDIHEFQLQSNEYPLRFLTFFDKNKLKTITLKSPTLPNGINFSSNQKTFFSLFEALTEFITKKSKYRIRFLFE